MFRQIFAILILATCSISLSAQPDSLADAGLLPFIQEGRKEMIRSFEETNRPEVQFWMDSLQRLENELFLTLQWDERWLLYLWLENYSALFAEVQIFDSGLEEVELLKLAPPPDSLFQHLDVRLYEERAYLFDQVRKAWLSAEERAFTSLLINYLLRLSTEEPEASAFDKQLNAFLKEYPSSRFTWYIHRHLYNIKPPGNWAFCMDLLFLNGNWTEGMERTLRPAYGGEIALGYWVKRWNAGLRLAVGGQKLDRDMDEKGFIWPEEDPSTFFAIELETGYDIYNKPRLRIFPSFGGGFGSVRPSENEEEPNPVYYDHFKFNGWHLTTALQADVKFNLKSKKVATTYHGVRVRIGHRWLNFEPRNPAMQGNMFFFAVGYTIFGRQPRY
ncbi:MAG: autotransporter outer membrane beta-barrel domain-containing protein [Bacteroidetes bacterium]|nr:MAG: autotransporter outer membrane beta-barrel domain-containing protein [Bacteroidota bacterium]